MGVPVRFVLVLSALLTTACASNVQRYADVDLSAKSVTVPPGGSGLTGKIKSSLSAAGWQMVVYRGPEVTRGSIGTKMELSSSGTFNSRYNLVVLADAVDMCLNLQPMIHYDISLIDNESGAEVITMSGTGCETDVANAFAKELSGRP